MLNLQKLRTNDIFIFHKLTISHEMWTKRLTRNNMTRSYLKKIISENRER